MSFFKFFPTQSKKKRRMVLVPSEKMNQSPKSKIVDLQEVFISAYKDPNRKEEVAQEHYRVLCEDGSVWEKVVNTTDKTAYWECIIEPFDSNNGYQIAYDPLNTRV